jgi:hypothetical protein
MDLKIFKPGSTEAEFNQFISENIMVKCHFLEDGTVYVFWQNPLNAGMNKIAKVELINSFIVQKEQSIIADKLEIDHANTAIADFKEKQAKYQTNQKEWDMYEGRIKAEGGRIFKSTETIQMFSSYILIAKAAIQAIINGK